MEASMDIAELQTVAACQAHDGQQEQIFHTSKINHGYKNGCQDTHTNPDSHINESCQPHLWPTMPHINGPH